VHVKGFPFPPIHSDEDMSSLRLVCIWATQMMDEAVAYPSHSNYGRMAVVTIHKRLPCLKV
jgi:hypothetical protein